MVAIVDYGAGNLFSVANALEHLAVPCQITRAPKVLEQADGILLPGVGAFPDAMEMLQERGLVPLLRHMALEKPFLGICLGMQVLFSQGEEFRLTQGLNLLPGRVEKLRAPALKFPIWGGTVWNLCGTAHSPGGFRKRRMSILSIPIALCQKRKIW